MLLPQLSAHVTATELERHRTILKVSELTVHTDRSDPDVILSKSWKPANTPQVLAVAFALQQSWSRNSLLQYAQQIGVSMNENDLTINTSPVELTATEPASRRSRKKSTKAA